MIIKLGRYIYLKAKRNTKLVGILTILTANAPTNAATNPSTLNP